MKNGSKVILINGCHKTPLIGTIDSVYIDTVGVQYPGGILFFEKKQLELVKEKKW
ncbi:MAG: hypothetical protein V4549_03310 [Bacteroidota bacterium]